MSGCPIADLVAICERIANQPKYPARIVDWASDLYDRLVDPKAMVRVEDLALLQAVGEDVEYGLGLIDNALARRGE